MSRLKIFSVDVLNENFSKLANKLGANVIVSNERKNISIENNAYQYINAEKFRIEGTWDAYRFNLNVIGRLWEKKAGAFNIDGIDIRPMVAKTVYWTNYRTGALRACINELFKEAEILNMPNFLSGNKSKELIKYWRNYTMNTFFGIFRKNHQMIATEKREIGILINDEFELNLYQYVIENLPSHSFIIFHYGNIHPDKLNSFINHPVAVDISKIESFVLQKTINPFNLDSHELSVANLIYKNWNSISSEISRYKFIKESGVKRLLMNVGENIPVRNLMESVFDRETIVMNTMNGLKSGEAHDADIYFNKWFVWDEKMKEMLVDKCGIEPEKLIVSGHLTEDYIQSYTYKSILNLDRNKLNGKKVISLFSVRGNREEKNIVYTALYEKLGSDNTFFLIIKPHPLEKPEEYILPLSGVKNVYFVEDKLKNSKDALYDQLILSDLSIVFGSTVALESKWMNVPCLTFENKESSFIYGVDQDKIKHIKSKDELNQQLMCLQKKSQYYNSENENTVAGVIVKELLGTELSKTVY